MKIIFHCREIQSYIKNPDRYTFDFVANNGDRASHTRDMIYDTEDHKVKALFDVGKDYLFEITEVDSSYHA